MNQPINQAIDYLDNTETLNLNQSISFKLHDEAQSTKDLEFIGSEFVIHVPCDFVRLNQKLPTRFVAKQGENRPVWFMLSVKWTKNRFGYFVLTISIWKKDKWC